MNQTFEVGGSHALRFAFADQQERFPKTWTRASRLLMPLRYGENPHQQAALYEPIGPHARGIAQAKQVQGKAKFVQDRARGMAIERGLVKPTPDPVGVMDPEISGTSVWPAAEGLSDQPLHDPAFGAHEALPEELVGAGDPPDGTNA